jgi:hypothetical protein
MKFARKRLTYANVVSSIALFLVVAGGSAFAANQLGKNTVGSKQLKNNAVTSAKIKNNAVTSAKVKNHSLTAADLKAGVIPSVPSSLLTPIAVFQLNALGFINQVVRAPITGPLTMSKEGTGDYQVSLPGITTFSYRQYPTVCGSGDDPGDSVVEGSLGGKLLIEASDKNGVAKDVAVTCSVYLLPEIN